MVPGESTRPIMDRVKEALFSIIGPDIAESNFLDLFGGTGAVGIEALSRGAKLATFVELDRLALQTIRENLKTTQLEARAQILAMDAFALLKRKPDVAYDFLFIAPPQYQGMWHQALTALDKNTAWLESDPMIIVQIDPREDEPLELKNLEEYDRRKYGKTTLLFYETIAAESEDQDEEASGEEPEDDALS